MSTYFPLLLPLQRFFMPLLIALLGWSVWRTVVRKDLAAGLALYIALVVVVDGFMNTGIYVPGLQQGSIRYSEVCALFLLFHLPPAGERKPPWKSVHWLLPIYFTLLLISVLRTDDVWQGTLEFRRLIMPQFVAFLIARRGLREPEDYSRFILWMGGLVVFMALFIFWDLFFDRWILQSDMLDKGIYSHSRGQKRFGGFFLNPNYLGAFVVLLFPMFFVTALAVRKVWQRAFLAMALLGLVFSLIETQSRGAVLAFAVSLVVMLFGPSGQVSRSKRIGMFALFLCVFALFMPGFAGHVLKRFSDTQTVAVEDVDTLTAAEGRSRETTWLYTGRMIEGSPVLGIGFGEEKFTATMIDMGFVEEYGVQPLDAPHNSYLQIAVYAGIPALLAFLFANLSLLVRALALTLSRGAEQITPTVFGLTVGIIGFLASIFTDLQLFQPNIAAPYWVLFGFLLALVSGAPATAALPSASAAGRLPPHGRAVPEP
jgi:O-antigen ligase